MQTCLKESPSCMVYYQKKIIKYRSCLIHCPLSCGSLFACEVFVNLRILLLCVGSCLKKVTEAQNVGLTGRCDSHQNQGLEDDADL